MRESGLGPDEIAQEGSHQMLGAACGQAARASTVGPPVRRRLVSQALPDLGRTGTQVACRLDTVLRAGFPAASPGRSPQAGPRGSMTTKRLSISSARNQDEAAG